MVKMISPDKINFRATVSEAEIRQRMSDEVLESIGAIDPATGKPFPGITAEVKRGDGRAGGYTIDVSGPMPARIAMQPARQIAEKEPQ